MSSTTPSPRSVVSPLDDSSVFLRAGGLVIDEVSQWRVTGHMQLGPDHHTPWGIVHGGVYSTAIESAASVGANAAVRTQGRVAVGITNTTHFLRSLTAGRMQVDAVALHQGRSHRSGGSTSTTMPGDWSPTVRYACRTSPPSRHRWTPAVMGRKTTDWATGKGEHDAGKGKCGMER